MKKKLDLNNLLAKYEGISSNTAYNFQPPQNQSPIQEEFYQYKTYQNEDRDHNIIINQANVTVTNQNFKGNFMMSKSQVEQHLLAIKDQLKNEQKSMSFYTENAIKQLHQTFQRNHEKVRRQILEMLDRAFIDNERVIKEELLKQSKIEPPQFIAVHRKISSLDDDINRMLANLKGNQYRKTIAEVVTRDFSVQIVQLRASIVSAKDHYLASLGEVEPDRTRIQSIKENLSKLFYFSKKTQPINNRISNDPPQIGGIFSLFNKPNPQPQMMQSQAPNPQQRSRKSFFNFGE